MSEPVISQKVIGDLIDALSRNRAPWQNEPARNVYAIPAFGRVYFGALGRFAGGKRHYGMVCSHGRQRDNRPAPSVQLAPITSRKHGGRHVMRLPPGELPPAVSPDGVRRYVASYVLLNIRINVSIEWLARDFRNVTQLPERFCAEARERMRQSP
ncbi:MAG: hypothetical protein GX608_02300 [Lentisphaerae bacterium]|nr:hypothetical protein [Lentisphaerota bacterium]